MSSAITESDYYSNPEQADIELKEQDKEKEDL